MKKRKGEDVGDEEISPKKSKVSGFVEGKGNNKPGDLVRAVKGLLQKEQTRLSGLTKLLNALKESQNKEMIEGIIKEGGEFQEVFKILEGGRHNLSQLEIQKCLEILQSILLFTADGMQLSSRVGMSIVQRVLQGHMKTLYTCLNPGNPPDVIKAALRLLTAMVTQGASAAREVQRSFDFTLKSLGSLTNKRDTKSAQDVRTCFIYFCLSFLMFGDLAVMKQILELRGFLQSIVKGLQFDSPNVVHAVLSTFQTRVVQNAGITKKTKVQFFNSYVLSQLATLYQYSKDPEEERPQTVRQQVHELLLKICGSFKFGICFSNTTGAFATRSNNPVLLRFLQSLSSVASDVLIQELVIKVLCCCQDVVSPFLSGLTAMFEPRLSIPWVSSMNLVTKIYMALPLPSHVLKKTSLKMSVDMLPSLMKMVIPAGISRAVLNRGVQHSSSLVKHLTLSLLVVILERAQNAAECLSCQSNSVVTLEHTNAQSETTLLQQFREEILKGLPDVKTVISLRQNLAGSNAKEDLQEDATSPTTLLAQSLKVILGFQTLWPSILSHINFDLKKLLPGQQQINFPPIVEHLTLQILLQAPAGSLKWHQQKGKNSTSFVYSVISLYTSARNENIKDKAKQLLWKLLSETGLVSNGTSEVDIWLTQLEQCEVHKGCKETLLWFLDEVFTAVSSEPHVYADIIVDMQGEVAALEARVAQSGMDVLEWNLTSGTSLPVSLLLLGALKRYTEMVGETSEPAKEATARNTDCVARYMNCVIFDMIHCSVNPIILGFTVCRYYGNAVIPKHLKGLRGVHQALLQYVSYWLPGEIQEKFRYFKEQARGNEKYLTKLYNFLGKTTVKTEKEKEMASAELYHHLELLDGVQLRTVICGCVEFCKSHLSGDFSPLVDVVKVKNHKFTGVTSIENIAPLLQVLPFSVFLWQVVGESLQDDKTSPHEIQQDIPLEKDVLSPILSAWIQDLLIRALEKEPISKTVSHCRHLLLCLNALKTELFSVSNSLGQQRLQSAMLLCFQLLQCLVQRSVAVQQNVNENKSNILEVERAGLSSSTLSSPTVVLEPDFEAICRSVLHHPVLLNCFLWQPELASSQAICKDLSVQLSYSTCNLLLAVLPSLTLQQKHTLMGPFVKKLSHAGGTEIQSAQEGNVGSSYQVLYLLGLFHEYCDHKTREQLISTLSELPSNMLVSTDSASGNALPSAFLLTLLTLLKGASLSEDNLSQSSSALSRNAESNAKEPLTVAHFKQLIKISVDVNCPQLDATIMELLQRSLLYVQSSTTSLLDSCLDNPSEAKVAVAAYLVVHSPSLRSHFELRCLSRSNTLKMKAHAKTSPIQFNDHLKEFLPLVSSYLFCVRGLDQDTSGENRAQAVISHLLQLCWEPLWEWLVGDREGTFKSSEEQCMKLLVAMIHIKKRDDGLKKTFRELLSKASLWDKFQFRICYHLLRRLCHECSADEEGTGLTSAFSFACMDYLSIVLGRKGDKKDEDDVFEDSLAHLELICKESTPLSIYNDSCVSTWNIFVTNSLRYNYESANVLRALRYIIQTLYTEETSDKCVSSTLLPLDTLYEMVLSHSQFVEVILSDEEAGKKNLKEALTELMVAIVEKSPACCQSSHLPVLFAAYTASLSTADQSILYLLNLYEKNHTSFKNYRPTLWGPAAASHHQIAKSLGPSLWQQPSVTEVLEQLDARRMNQSAVSFPQNRRLQPQIQPEFSHEKPQGVYDPCFLLPLFSCLLAPNYQVDCRKFVEQGCLSFTVASLSSRDAHVRQAGYHVLTRFITHLEGARFKERKQIFHLLKCLKNGITEANVRISSVMVCFIARVAYILLKPEHPFYIMMNSYLLQRPALDLRDLPLFYSMFNSSTMQHATERSWMLHLLVDGMKDSPDYYLYKRRHVIELALSYHDSPVSDQRSQDLVTQLLLSALKIHPAAYDLAKNYGVIAWIHSLCFKSPESLCTSLNLLYTLWFTLYRGEVEKRVAVTRNEGGNDTHVQKVVRLPPNVAQECVLVCWTLLEQLRSQPLARDTSGFFELLAAVTSYLKANQQQSGLSRDRIVSLLHLWYAAFDETCALNQLLSSLSIDKGSSIDTQPCADCNDSKMKTDSLYSLLSILTTWEPALSSETDESVLLVWRFGLSWRHKSSMDNTLGNCCRRGEESQIPISLLSLLRWFRKCLVRNRTLQNHLVTESPTVEIKVILQIYQAGLASAKTGLLEHWGHRGSQINVRFSVIRELNIICLILFAALQRSKHGNGLPLPQPAVCQLISQEPYAALITKGLQEVLLPLLPNPSSEFEDVSFQGQDVIVQELVFLFMQELWMERPSPDNFLSFLLSHTGCGLPVVDSLVLALGGTKVIASWTQNTNM